MRMQLMQTSIFLLLSITQIAVAAPLIAKRNCKNHCGDISIPYPFGIGTGCYLDKSFEISCNDRVNPPSIWLESINMEVLDISLNKKVWITALRKRLYIRLPFQYVRVKSPIISQNCPGKETGKFRNLTGSPFFYTELLNRFVAAGCDNRASMIGTEPAIVGCHSGKNKKCSDQTSGPYYGPCDGETCCEAALPSALQSFNATFDGNQAKVKSESGGCKLAFLVERAWFYGSGRNDSGFQSREYVPAILSWGIAEESLAFPINENSKEYVCTNFSDLINTSYSTVCRCFDGYEGNPYLLNGCQDIDECKDPNLYEKCGNATCVNKVGSYDCERRNIWIILGCCLGFGGLLLFIGGWCLYKLLKKRRKIKQKKTFFKRNGGLLLQQQMFSSEGNIQKAKLFNSNELDKATDHFNKNRILGQGGQGTVYKGMLVDGRIVAIKKSIVMHADKVEEFINEVVILSQINHRNVVKLLGCCLETEVPLLVYEFISNGTIFQYLHDKNEEFQLSWEMRLRIATEAAEALSYLHSSASLPIYHRDIKSTNILLDDKYRAKVSDFGASRSLAIEKTHLTTDIRGTIGYLDPEYFQSSQFTEKSDVYSFGVVLVELITGEKPISTLRAAEGRSLATHFILSMEENRLIDIVDSRIMQDSVHEEIIAAAMLAYRCLSLSGKNRPTMKEVAVELHRIPSLQKASNVQQTHEEVEYVTSDFGSLDWLAASTSTASASDTGSIHL